MTTDTPTPSDQLHALYQLSDRVVPEGFAWPLCLRQNSPDSYSYIYAFSIESDESVSEHSCHIGPKDALAIVERAAEDWLESKGWVWESGHSMRAFTLNGYVTTHNSLPAALAAENGRGG